MAEKKKNVKPRKGLVVSSVLMILAGLLSWAFPDSALLAAALYLGIIFLIGGFAYLLDFYYLRSGWLLAVGALDVILGVVLILNLGITLASLPFLLAFWILSVAVSQISFGVDAKSAGDTSWKWLILSGITGVLFGLWILGAPAIGFLTVSTLVGMYLVFYGCLGIAEYREEKKAAPAAA